MPEDAKLKLNLRLVPAEGEPNAAVLDDIVKMVRQAIATSPREFPVIDTSGEFRPPADNSQNSLESRIKHRVEQASEESRTQVEKRNETAALPEGEHSLKSQSFEAAQNLVSTVQGALIRGIVVRVPDGEK